MTKDQLKKFIVELEEENKTLKDNVEFLHSCLDDRDKSIAIMQEENKKLKKYYDRDKEELMESCYSLAKENEKLKSDLDECECSMHFENDEVGYRKRECKKLKLENADLMGERDGLKMAVEKLKEENQTLELWLDSKEKLNEEYRKQIDKLRTDNIYEEGLYD